MLEEIAFKNVSANYQEDVYYTSEGILQSLQRDRVGVTTSEQMLPNS